MATESAIAESSPPGARSWKRVALRWWLWGALSVPPAALLHELGHFLVFWSLGLPGAALHYGSAGFNRSGVFFNAVMKGDLAAAAEVAPVWGVATALAMGLVATYAVVFACCTLCAKWKATPVARGHGLSLQPSYFRCPDRCRAYPRRGPGECRL